VVEKRGRSEQSEQASYLSCVSVKSKLVAQFVGFGPIAPILLRFAKPENQQDPLLVLKLRNSQLEIGNLLRPVPMVFFLRDYR
jgi:hypothetical protein